MNVGHGWPTFQNVKPSCVGISYGSCSFTIFNVKYKKNSRRLSRRFYCADLRCHFLLKLSKKKTQKTGGCTPLRAQQLLPWTLKWVYQHVPLLRRLLFVCLFVVVLGKIIDQILLRYIELSLQNTTFGLSSSGCHECHCNPYGSANMQCNVSGQCPCKANVTGEKCTQCISGFYGLPNMPCAGNFHEKLCGELNFSVNVLCFRVKCFRLVFLCWETVSPAFQVSKKSLSHDMNCRSSFTNC